MIDIDYSKIEARIAEHYKNKRQVDIHAETAADLYNVPMNQVTPEQRKAAKCINWFALYSPTGRIKNV